MPPARSSPVSGASDAEAARESEAEHLLAEAGGSEGRGSGLRARRPGGAHGPDDHLLAAAAAAYEEEEDHPNPTVAAELPLRALASGLSLLSLEELRRLHLPSFPWQTGADGSPSMLESLRKKPWKAHYTTALGFILSSGASPAPPPPPAPLTRRRSRARGPPLVRRGGLSAGHLRDAGARGRTRLAGRAAAGR